MTKQEEIQDLKRRAQNKSLPASAVAALNKMIADLEKEESKKDVKEKTSPKEDYTHYEDAVTTSIEELGEMSRGDAQGVAEAHVSIIKKGYKDNFAANLTAKEILKKGETKKEEKKESKKPDYDCDELIEKAKKAAKKAKESAKKSANKPEVTKAKEKIERTHETIEKKIEKGEFTKAQVAKLIGETKDLLKMLEKALKSL